jgi:hypothetical protein
LYVLMNVAQDFRRLAHIVRRLAGRQIGRTQAANETNLNN